MKERVTTEAAVTTDNPNMEVTAMTPTYDVYTIAINVDRPTRRITLHTPACKWWHKHMPTTRKGEKEELRDGGWIFYKSKSAATKYVVKHHPNFTVSKCRFCHKAVVQEAEEQAAIAA